MLFPTDLITYHYAFWRPGKYKDLRCDQLNRHTGYWETFYKGLNKIYDKKYLEIDVRPIQEEHLTTRYIRFFEMSHPTHVKEHPCYDEEISEDVKNEILNNKLIFKQ